MISGLLLKDEECMVFYGAGSQRGRNRPPALFVYLKTTTSKTRQKNQSELKETGEKYKENNIPCVSLMFLACRAQKSLNINSNTSSSKLQTGQTLLPSSER